MLERSAHWKVTSGKFVCCLSLCCRCSQELQSFSPNQIWRMLVMIFFSKFDIILTDWYSVERKQTYIEPWNSSPPDPEVSSQPRSVIVFPLPTSWINFLESTFNNNPPFWLWFSAVEGRNRIFFCRSQTRWLNRNHFFPGSSEVHVLTCKARQSSPALPGLLSHVCPPWNMLDFSKKKCPPH